MGDLFSRGWLSIGRWKGAPIRLHWTVPVGAVVFGRLEFVPGFWLGFVLLVLIHELGHAQVVASCRKRILSIDVHGLGGWCRWDGDATPIQRALIAWGGVWAQMILLAVTLTVAAVLGPPSDAFSAQLHHAFVSANLWVMAINLLPFPPLDGAEAWTLLRLLRPSLDRGVQRARQQGQRARNEIETFKEVHQMDALERELAERSDPIEEADELLRKLTEEVKASRKKQR